MKPTPCPSRLKELISLANLEPDSETRKHLQAVARAFRAKRQQQDEGDSIEIARSFVIHIDLRDGKVWGVFDELADALNQTASESNLDRIRECPICSEIFWAGRSDKEACTRHAARRRQQEKRGREKTAKEQRAKRRAKQKKRKAEKPLKLSMTTATICDAIFDRHQNTESILDYCYMRLHGGIYRGATIHRGIKLLVDAGYLDPGEEQEETKNRHYTSTEKLKRLRREMLAQHGAHYSFRRVVTESERPATH